MEDVKGFRRGRVKNFFLLYTEDILLFLGDMEHSLITAMEIIKIFDSLSGLSINWEKTVA